MTQVFRRILECKRKVRLSWWELSKKAKIKIGSWMTGLPISQPTDEELRRMAPVLKTTYEYLKTGKK